MNYLKQSYTSITKKAKQWYNPNQNPTDFDKYAFNLLDKAQVDLFIQFIELNNVNIHVVDFNKASLLIKAQGIPSYTNQHTKLLSQEQLIKRAIKAINYLVKKGVDINYKNKNGITALLSASHWGYYDVVQTLLIHGADPNIGSDGLGLKTNPLLSSFFKGHDKIAQLLLSYGADPSETQRINSHTSGFRLSDEQIDKLYSYHNIYKLVYLRRMQQSKNKDTILTNCSEMMFDQICKNV